MSTSKPGAEAIDLSCSHPFSLACNPATPANILDSLSDHTSMDVLVRLAENPNCSAQTLAKLCRHQAAEVRAAAGENGNISLDDLRLLCGDQHADVRYQLAENYHLPSIILDLLYQDDNPYVSHRAQQTLQRLKGKPQTEFAATTNVSDKPSTGSVITSTAFDWQQVCALNSQLTSRIMQLAQENADLQATLTRSLEAANLQSSFVNNLSHDLRTPLSAILGMNELLLSTTLTEEQKTLANAVQESAQTLLNITSDITDLSKMEVASFKQESVPFNIIFLIQDLARAAADSAKKRNLMLVTRIDQRIPEFVLGDPSHMREILFNLIGNSMQCSPPGEVTIEALVAAESDKQITLRFAVKDTGSFSLSDNDQIIPARTAHTPAQQYDNMRVGLTLSKQLIELLGGHLQVECDANKGSAVSFTLNYDLPTDTGTPQTAAEPHSGSAAVPLQDCLLLVVEDSPVLRGLVVKQLSNLGIQAQSVANGAEAVAASREIAFDLIFMDCHLPEVDGFEATKTIRGLESKSGRHTPIIALTADALKSDAEKCMAAGMDDYLSKPVSIEQLRQKIQQWLPLTKRHEYGGSITQQLLRSLQ